MKWLQWTFTVSCLCSSRWMQTLGINQLGHDLAETFMKKELQTLLTHSLLTSVSFFLRCRGWSSLAPVPTLLLGTKRTRNTTDIFDYVNCISHSVSLDPNKCNNLHNSQWAESDFYRDLSLETCCVNLDFPSRDHTYTLTVFITVSVKAKAVAIEVFYAGYQ